MNDINDAVSKIETSQDNLNTNLKDSLSNLASNTENTNQSIISLKKAMQEMVTLSE
jgi:t-SNARE complex subunit (syntaxin)